jgi:hypothetical protein
MNKVGEVIASSIRIQDLLNDAGEEDYLNKNLQPGVLAHFIQPLPSLVSTFNPSLLGETMPATNLKAPRKRSNRERSRSCSFPFAVAQVLKNRAPDSLLIPRPTGMAVLRKAANFESRLVKDGLRLSHGSDRKGRSSLSGGIFSSPPTQAEADSKASAAFVKQLKNYGLTRDTERDLTKTYDNYRFVFEPLPNKNWFLSEEGIDSVCQRMKDYFLSDDHDETTS